MEPGLYSFNFFENRTMWIIQAIVLIAVGGFYFSYRRHRCMYPLLTAIPSGLLIFYAYHFKNSGYQTYFLYIGMLGLLAATIWNYQRKKLHGNCYQDPTYKGKKVELQSTLTCPNCGHKKTEIMPTDACVYFYECEKCKTRIKPLQGDCCVYCSYGTVKCPSIQAGECCAK